MELWKIIVLVLAIFMLPSIIFQFIDPKKLGEKIDEMTRTMQEKSRGK